MAGELILVIEDDASVRTLLDKSLTAKGYKVKTCEDGLVGLTALETTRPDLIIVDIMMPRLDGMTFVKAIKSPRGDQTGVAYRPGLNVMRRTLLPSAAIT